MYKRLFLLFCLSAVFRIDATDAVLDAFEGFFDLDRGLEDELHPSDVLDTQLLLGGFGLGFDRNIDATQRTELRSATDSQVLDYHRPDLGKRKLDFRRRQGRAQCNQLAHFFELHTARLRNFQIMNGLSCVINSRIHYSWL